ATTSAAIFFRAVFRMAESVILPSMSSLSRPSLKLFAVAGLMFLATTSGSAQSRAIVAVEDYQRAETFMNYNTTPLVSNGPVRATWLPGDRFWYRNTNATGSEFVLVDAVKGTRAPAFNHAAVAAALTTARDMRVSATQLPFQQITFGGDGASFSFESGDKRWTCDVRGQQCATADRPRPVPNSEMSPDGKLAAYIKDYNLWVRDLATGTDKQLTTDGDR